MISAINFVDRMALLENGQTVPIVFLDGDDQVDCQEEADSILAGPWFDWNGTRYERKFVKVRIADIELLGDGQAN